MQKNFKFSLIIKPLIGVIIFIIFSLLFKYFFNENYGYKKHEIFGETFQTSYYISIYTNKDIKKNEINDDVKQIFNKINNLFNVYDPNSLISKFNSNQKIQIDNQEFIKLFNITKNINIATNGMYDPSVILLSRLWGFFDTIKQIPNEQNIGKVLKNVGMNNFTIRNNNVVKLNDNSMLDFSSIAKGYAVDLVKELFINKYGFNDFLIEIGGEIYAKGKIKNKLWRVGIASPSFNSGKIGNYITISDNAVATSGNYNNFLLKLNKKHGHIISPKSGKPMSHKTLSTTVVSKQTVFADAWATAFFLLPYKDAISLANEQKIALMVIYKENEKLKTAYSNDWVYKKLD